MKYRIGLLVFFLGVGIPQLNWATPSFVQGIICKRTASASSTLPCTFASATLPGSVIVASHAYALGGGVVTAITFTDDTGGTYSTYQSKLDVPIVGEGGALGVGSVGAGGTTTVTATLTNSVQPTYQTICIIEYSGADPTNPVDVSVGNGQVAPGTGTDAVTSTAATPGAANSRIVGGIMSHEVNSTMTQGTGFASRVTTSTGIGARCEDLAQGVAASIAATGTSGSATANTLTFMVALKSLLSTSGSFNPVSVLQGN